MSTNSSPIHILISTKVVSSSECPTNEKQRVEPNGECSSNSGLNSSASSLTTITTDLSLILQQFECCVCLDYITPSHTSVSKLTPVLSDMPSKTATTGHLSGMSGTAA